MIQKPKYQFGLLQTPSDAEARGGDSSSSIYPSKTPSTGERPSPTSTPVIRRNSSFPQRTPASMSSARTPRVRSASNTPYTTSSTVSIDHSSSSIAALVEGRGHARGEVGITSLDLKESVLVLSQFSDSQTYTKTLAKLHHINPMEILLPNTLCESGANNKLFSLLTNHFPNVTKSAVQRRYYNEAKGLYYIKNLCASEYHSIELQISNKYYCLATTGALLKYVEFIQNIIFAPRSLKAVYRGCEHTTMIDTTTVRNLELLQNLKNPMSRHTLFGILNHTKTPGGGRLLRSNILQPPNDEETIRLRQDAVMELTEKEEVFFNLQRVISKFVDIGHVVSMCVQIPKTESVKTAESKLNCVIVLKHVLELVEPLKETLSYCENQLLQIYCKALTDARYDIILDKIKSVIREETHLQKGLLQQRTEKCFAVRPQINGLLDVARRTYSELVDDIHAIVQQLSETHKLALKTAYSSLRGFHIQMTADRGNSKYSSDSLPPVFIKVAKFKNTLSFTTMDVIQQNERIKIALDEIYMMSNIIVSELLGSVHEHIGCLYQLSDIVSMVDLILSFAHAATVSSYVCPEFTDTLAIKQGAHPMLKKVSHDNLMANDTFFCHPSKEMPLIQDHLAASSSLHLEYSSEHRNFVVITGPNMGGKSTYLRQVALLQIMAQMGSFVPAQYASFRIADQIFSRLGSDDDMESNSSTFTLEMKETNYILQNITDNSLIIIDELGRGTSAEEGVGICWSISEHFLKTKAFTFFVTHFKQLTDLSKIYPNVANYFFEVHRVFNQEAKCEKVSYTHILSRGITPETHYGLKLAETSAFPASVIQDAIQIALQLDTLKQKTHSNDPELIKNNAVFNLATRLIQIAKNSRMDNDSLKIYVKSLHRTYWTELTNLT